MFDNQRNANKGLEAKVLREGLELWKRQKDEARRRKIQEQIEMKEMLDRYWPFEKKDINKPRGLRNLRLEELWPNKDYQNTKRCRDPIEWGGPGGGAPIIRDGQKVTKTKEDPQLRFQLGSKDLKRVVDNDLRYKTNREEQMVYKKQLDKMVEEKQQKKLKEKLKEAEWERKKSWSNEETLKKLQQLNLKNDRIYERFKNTKYEPRPRKLSPISMNKENEGAELVELLSKRRTNHSQLNSTDITKQRPMWSKDSKYLQDLTQQMLNKRQHVQQLKLIEAESVKQHYNTWDTFWGKPDHGVPRKKTSIERVLYPSSLAPIGVA